MKTLSFNTKFLNSRIIQHVLFWSFFFTMDFIDVLQHTEVKSILFILLITILKLWDTVFIVYLNRFLFIPKFFIKKKYITHIVITIIAIFGFATISYFLLRPIMANIEFSSDRPGPKRMVFWGSVIQSTLLVILTTLIHFTKEWIKVKDIEINLAELEKEKLDAELKSLKAQINPHFLFNMLNNIYSLSLEKSDKSPKMILMLSDLMSYILYDCQDEKVSIEKEIQFLKNLIELEIISVGEDVSIEFNFDDSLISHQVSPLLFIPFVENAFKHCSKNGKDKSFVNINLNHVGDKVCLKIENSTEQTNELINDNYHGVGITNVEKRLTLLYPNKHHLAIQEKEDSYKTELCLEL
jgi:sensor histidine kinase YesM